MSKIQEKITVIMDELQQKMESNAHLTDLAAVVTLLARVSIYRAHMNDEDKDYHDAIVWWLEEYPEGKAWREE